MAVKKPGKAPAKSEKISSKSKAKAKSTESSMLLAHWLQDASLENLAPQQAFAEGERQLELSIRANQTTLQHPQHTKLELRLRAHIHVQGQPFAMAEVRYASVVVKSHAENQSSAILMEMFPFARSTLADLLKMAGHEPPLPERLEPENINT